MNLKEINKNLSLIEKSLTEAKFRYQTSLNFFVVATNSGRVPTHTFVPLNGNNRKSKKFAYYKFSPKKYTDIAKNRYDYGDEFAKELAGFNAGLGYDKLSPKDVVQTIDQLSKVPAFKTSYKKIVMDRNQLYKYLTTDLKTPLDFYEESFGDPPASEDVANFKVGNSEVIIPDSIPQKRISVIKTELEKIYGLFKKAGIPQVVTGPIRFTKIGGRTLGFYDEGNKDIKIGDKAKFDSVLEHTIIHEYGHKWYYEFIKNKIPDIQSKFNDLRYNKRERFDNSDAEKAWNKFTTEFLKTVKVGDIYTYEGRQRSVKGTWQIVKIENNKIYVALPGEKQWKWEFNPTWFMNNKVKFEKNPKANKLTGVVMVPDKKNSSNDWFPTKYSESSESEWFAELFAFYIAGKLKGKPAKFIKSMLK